MALYGEFFKSDLTDSTLLCNDVSTQVYKEGQMFDADKIKDLAKQTLAITTSENTRDYSLWHRAQRLVRNIDCIINLPELIQDTSHIDYHCLIAAALFSDAGLADCFDTQKETLKSLMTNTNKNSQI